MMRFQNALAARYIRISNSSVCTAGVCAMHMEGVMGRAWSSSLRYCRSVGCRQLLSAVKGTKRYVPGKYLLIRFKLSCQ